MADITYAHIWTLSSVSGSDPNWGTLQVADRTVHSDNITLSETATINGNDELSGTIGGDAGPFWILASYTFSGVTYTLLRHAGGTSYLATTTPLSGGQIDTAFASGTIFQGTQALDNPDTVCFLKGTRILTRTGYRPVESLAEGDEIQTLNHGWQPVRWVGHKEIQPRPHGGFAITELPIRIARDAFGAGLPVRDLWVSPNHAIFFRDHLIPAKHLVNGVTVTRDSGVENIVYYHVLLNRHAVIFSEALSTESYVPAENQDFFENADAIPDELAKDMSCQIGPMMNDCYPRTSQGPAVETARAYLAKFIPNEKAAEQVAA